MQSTSILGLLKPELSDPADITALNGNWDKIDTLRQGTKLVTDANLNDLTDEGVYLCTGTITHAPVSTTVCIVEVISYKTNGSGWVIMQRFYNHRSEFLTYKSYIRVNPNGAINAVWHPWNIMSGSTCNCNEGRLTVTTENGNIQYNKFISGDFKIYFGEYYITSGAPTTMSFTFDEPFTHNPSVVFTTQGNTLNDHYGILSISDTGFIIAIDHTDQKYWSWIALGC